MESLATPPGGKGVGQSRLSYSAAGHVKWWNHFRKMVWQIFVKLKRDLPYGPATPFLGFTQEE